MAYVRMAYVRIFYLVCDGYHEMPPTTEDCPGVFDGITKGDAETVGYRHGWSERLGDHGLTHHLCPTCAAREPA